MSENSWVETVEGWGEIVESSQSRFGSTSFRVIGSFGEGWFSAREILSEDFTTELHFDHEDGGKHNTTQIPEENKWLDGGTKLPWNPKPTEEWHGELNQEFEDHDISLTDTNSLKGHDVHPDPEDHNSIYDHKQSSFLERTAFDSEDTDYDEDEDYAEREHGNKHENKEASVGPRKAFVDYVNLIENNTLIREAAWKDVRAKAKRIWDSGKVHVSQNDGREIFAQVDGDNNRYDVQVHRKNAFGKGITWYDCNCEWGKWAYKRERSFIGRLCSHGLATYYAMQANTQPVRDVKRVDNKTERHSLAARDNYPNDERPTGDDLEGLGGLQFPKNPSPVNDDPWVSKVRKAPVVSSIPVERESRASQQGGISRRNAGLMVWDDNLPKVMKEFFNKEIPQNMGGDTSAADPAGAAPTDPTADLASQMGADPAAAPPVDPSADPTAAGPTTPDQYVRTAEFSKDPNTDDLFEEQGDDKDDTQFNDTGKDFKEKKNDPEFAFYDEFWGRSSAVGDGALDSAPIPEPGRKLPHFIRQKAQQSPAKPVFAAAEDAEDLDKVDAHNIDDAIKTYRLNGNEEAAHKMVQQKYKKKHHAHADDGEEDYAANTEKEHETDYQAHPDENTNHDDGKSHQEQYQSEHWLDEDEAEWNEFDPSEDDEDGEEEDHHTKSSRYHNDLEAEAFNDGADDIVREFQRSAAAQALFSNAPAETGGAFITAVDTGEMTLSKTAGRHFTFAEQDELINEKGVARHLGDLNLEGTFYQD